MIHWFASCLVPGITFHGIRTASWVSKSKNSVILNDVCVISVCFLVF